MSSQNFGDCRHSAGNYFEPEMFADAHAHGGSYTFALVSKKES